MQPPVIAPFLPPPSDQLLQLALDGLSNAVQHCTCPTHYHALWGALKAAGVHRALYTEAPVLEPVLRGLLQTAQHVLVAGSADTGALELLRHCAQGRALQWTVSDQCPAPLQLVERYSLLHALDCTTVQTDLAHLAPTAKPWDVVFVHYTLSFMDQATRRQVLQNLRSGLGPDGSIVCAAKFDTAPGNANSWLQAMKPRLQEYFSAHPQALSTLLGYLPGYAQQRSGRIDHQPTLEILKDDFAFAGLTVRSVSDTGRARWTHSSQNPAPDRQSSLLLLAAHAT
jgi:hypothetical protein